jgi:hypothetical protein
VLPRSRGVSAVLERSPTLFKYFLDCPATPMAPYALERAGTLRGYFVLGFAPRQARLVDCWIDSEEAADWLALVQSAVSVAAPLKEVAELVTLASDPSLIDALTACGFHQRFSLPIQSLARTQVQFSTVPLRVQLLDCDLAYLHQGYPEFWA